MKKLTPKFWHGYKALTVEDRSDGWWVVAINSHDDWGDVYCVGGRQAAIDERDALARRHGMKVFFHESEVAPLSPKQVEWLKQLLETGWDLDDVIVQEENRTGCPPPVTSIPHMGGIR